MLRIKFREDNNLIELFDGIYVYKNFHDTDLIKDYAIKLESYEEKDWHQHGNFEIGDVEKTFWGDKCSLDILNSDFHDKIFNFFSPNYWMYQHTNFVRLKTGQKTDIFTEKQAMFNGVKVADYKVALYLGNFEGGDIVFPELDFRYSPEPNDLLIFKIHEKYNHYTDEVTSGTRYAYMDYLVYHPGYFMP